MLGNKLLNIQFAKYHISNNKSEGFPNMVLGTETLYQSVPTEYSEAVNARYTFQPSWVSDGTNTLVDDVISQRSRDIIGRLSVEHITCHWL